MEHLSLPLTEEHIWMFASLRFSLPPSLSLRLEEDEGVDLRNTVQPRTLSAEWKCCLGIQESQSLLSRNAESQRAEDLTLNPFFFFFIQRNEAAGGGGPGGVRVN